MTNRPLKLAAAAGALALLAPSFGAAHERIVPEGWQETYDNFHYAPAVRAGEILFLSGVVATLAEDETEADMEAAFDRAFEAIAGVLEKAGADWGDVVEMTTYHTELRAQGEAFMKVKDKWVKEPYPAWTAIDVDRLWPDRGIVEIRVIAHTPDYQKPHHGDDASD